MNIKPLIKILVINFGLNLFALLFPITSIPANITFQTLPSLAPMLTKVLPTVVSVHVEGSQPVRRLILPKEFRYFFGPDIPNNNELQPFEGLGSGVIINAAKGYVITNNHVVNGADKIKIQLNDGKEFNAKLIGHDTQTDLALLKIPVTTNLSEIKMADSDTLKVGDFTVAVGNPFGLGQTATSGIISALGRSGLNIEGLENFIQTDASINRGNSGGALVNLNGELIGINTAILAPGGGNVGIGFAIPSNIVKNLSQQLIKYGEVKRGQLGIKGTELTSDIAKAFNINVQRGAFVNEVLPNSAADKAGMKAGDTILSVGDKPIQSFAELRVKIGTTAPGKTIKLVILRNGHLKTMLVTLENSTNSINNEIITPALEGASFSNKKLPNGIHGVLVENIIKNSPAAITGLRKGDIIIGVNRQNTQNLFQLRKALESKPTVIALHVIRGETSIYLILH